MPGRDSIPTYGEEGLFVTRYLVSQIAGGRSNNIEDSLVDLSWKTFKAKNKTVADRWTAKNPSTIDKNKKVRDFYNAHKAKRFEKYIKSGDEGKCQRVI
jgi:Na+-transporting NADH:ubiquinone oxidoreductase subunit NqrC